MGKFKWQEYAFEEIKEKLLDSNSYTEWGRKMGYTKFNKTIAKSLFLRYPVLETLAENFKKKQDLTGKRFGKLVVLKFSEEETQRRNNSQKYWECQCDCGNIKYTTTRNLKSGLCKSCGCLQKEIAGSKTFIDLTGQTFGRLTVVRQGERPDEVDNTRAYWWCQCSCGNPNLILAQGQLLRNGHKTSCGCVISQYEEKAMQILNEHKISYKTQYTFENLKSDSGRPLRFDFAIFDDKKQLSHLVEIQGQQHFKVVPTWGGEEKFELNKKYDQMKRDFCKKNNIKLIEVSYKEDINLKTLGLNDFKE